MTENKPVFFGRTDSSGKLGDALYDAEGVIDLLGMFFANAKNVEGFERLDGYDPLHGMNVLLDCLRNVLGAASSHVDEQAEELRALRDAVQQPPADETGDRKERVAALFAELFVRPAKSAAPAAPSAAAGSTYPRLGPEALPVREAAIAATISSGYSVEAVAHAVNMKRSAVQRIAERLRGSGVLPPDEQRDDARAAC